NGNVTATSTAKGPATITGSGTLELNGATRTFTVNNGPQASDMVIANVIHGTGVEGLTKAGLGRLELDAVEAYTGLTTITKGNVILGNATLTGAVAVGIPISDSFTIIQTTSGTVSGKFAQGDKVFLGGNKFTIDYSDNTKVVLHKVLATTTTTVASSSNPSVY